VHLIPNSGAALDWRLTLVKAPQYKIYHEAPEEEASSGKAGDEECGNQKEKADADGEEGVDEGSGYGEEKTCCQRNEEGRDSKGDEEK
jgi:hypothetical protein